MILYCNFEELAALNAAVARSLEPHAAGGVIAPPDAMPYLEALMPRLNGDLSIESLADYASVRHALVYVTDELRGRLDAAILDQHPAAEEAVLAYFDFAHVLSVLNRLDALGREMEALASLMTGEGPMSDAVQRFTFSDDDL